VEASSNNLEGSSGKDYLAHVVILSLYGHVSF
jgi:hypothetical protein